MVHLIDCMCCVCIAKTCIVVSLHVGSLLCVRLIDSVTKAEGENTAREREREQRLRCMCVYSLPVWLWRTVTLFAWLVEPLRRDRRGYSVLPLSSSSFLSSLIYQSNFPSLPLFFLLTSCFKAVWPIVQSSIMREKVSHFFSNAPFPEWWNKYCIWENMETKKAMWWNNEIITDRKAHLVVLKARGFLQQHRRGWPAVENMQIYWLFMLPVSAML